MKKPTPAQTRWIGSTVSWIMVLVCLGIPSLYSYWYPSSTSSIPLFTSFLTATFFSFLAAHLDARSNYYHSPSFDTLSEEPPLKRYSSIATVCFVIALLFVFISVLYLLYPTLTNPTPYLIGTSSTGLLFAVVALILDNKHHKYTQEKQDLLDRHIDHELQLLDDPIPVQNQQHSPAFNAFMRTLLQHVPLQPNPYA